MKRLGFAYVLVLLTALTARAGTDWPLNTNEMPIARSTSLGSAYVVATNESASAVYGSIAIGPRKGGYALVNSVSNAVQIGIGTNATANTIQFMTCTVPVVRYVDTADDTVTGDYTPVVVGDILVGNTGGSNTAWMALGTTTNNWAPFAAEFWAP